MLAIDHAAAEDLRRWREAHPGCTDDEARSGVLARLIGQHSRDDQTWKLRPRKREVRACDLGPGGVGDSVVDCGPDRKPSTLVGVSMSWDRRHAGFKPGRDVCPACGNAIQRDRDHFCLVCSSSSKDPKQWPAQAGRMAEDRPGLDGGRGRKRG